MSGEAWKQYVTALARDAWVLDARGTATLLRKLDDLKSRDDVTDSAVAEVLYNVGVAEATADLIAPSIRARMAA